MSVTYLSVKQLLLIHSLLIDESGGAHGVREHAGLESCAALPRQTFDGKELYPSLFEKAAVYLRSILRNHPFVDGNKRTGMTAAFIFLESNGYLSAAERGQIEKFALQVVKRRLGITEIARWLRAHTRPASRSGSRS